MFIILNFNGFHDDNHQSDDQKVNILSYEIIFYYQWTIRTFFFSYCYFRLTIMRYINITILIKCQTLCSRVNLSSSSSLSSLFLPSYSILLYHFSYTPLSFISLILYLTTSGSPFLLNLILVMVFHSFLNILFLSLI